MSHARLMALPLALAVAGSAGLPAVLAPTTAYAGSLTELAQRIQESGAAYDEAEQRVEELQAKIEANEQRIAEIEAELPEKKQAAADSIRTLYKMRQSGGGILDLLLSADDFNEVISNARYLDTISAKNNEAVQELVSMSNELEQTRSALASEKAQADSDAKSAENAMSDAISARQQLEEEQAKKAAEEAAAAQAAVEAAQKAAEEAAAKEAEEAAAKAADDASSSESQGAGTFTTQSGNESKIQVPDTSTVDTSTVNWSDSKTEFVNKWTPRIDAYLSGSPLAGYGQTFAEAAWDYGVDPRFSPAISCVESSKGAVCFKSHNAWGWGSSSWGDWDSAIRDHVAGLAAGYGGQLSVSAAQKYCPPTWENWYASVLSEMNSI